MFAHPDDELTSLGSLLKIRDSGGSVRVTWIIDPTGRIEEGVKLAEDAGFQWEFLDLPLGRPGEFVPLSTEGWIREVATRMEPRLRRSQTLLLTNRQADSHQDHRAVNNVGKVLSRRNRQIWIEADGTIPGGWEEWAPNTFVDIPSDLVFEKKHLAERYRSVIVSLDMDLIEGLDLRARGWGAVTGRHHVEAFRMVKAFLP